MKISAHVKNASASHQVVVCSNGQERPLTIPPKPNGPGSSVNGGELLFLALATCYCNDVYREAAKRGLAITEVEVTVEGEFGAAGEPARNITYRAKARGHGSNAEIADLLTATDRVAEIQNTLRTGVAVSLAEIEALPA